MGRGPGNVSLPGPVRMGLATGVREKATCVEQVYRILSRSFSEVPGSPGLQRATVCGVVMGRDRTRRRPRFQPLADVFFGATPPGLAAAALRLRAVEVD